MVSAILIKKSMLMVGFLTHNDSDILRAKTGPYRCVGYQTNIPPTPVQVEILRQQTENRTQTAVQGGSVQSVGSGLAVHGSVQWFRTGPGHH